MSKKQKNEAKIESEAIVRTLRWVKFLRTYKHVDELFDEVDRFINREVESFPELKDVERY